MRHGRVSQRFDRPTDHRLAMFRNLVTELLKHEQIRTTEAKAKAIRPLAGYVYDSDTVHKVFDELGPRYASRPGGYTRIIKLGPRLGDGAPVVQLELV
jgi:large subunit ribosomal protein L17